MPIMFRPFLAMCWKEQAKLEEVSKESQRREEQIIADLEVCNDCNVRIRSNAV